MCVCVCVCVCVEKSLVTTAVDDAINDSSEVSHVKMFLVKIHSIHHQCNKSQAELYKTA
jgi:hypothetical protein